MLLTGILQRISRSFMLGILQRFYGRFVPLPFRPRSFRPLANSSQVVSSPVISSPCRFVPLPFCPLHVLSPSRFIPTLDTLLSINYFILVSHELYIHKIYLYLFQLWSLIILSSCHMK
jgi:hypothetical protein